MPKLFMFYLGGTISNANTELHDVRFAVGESVEDCHADLRSQWWGAPESLHLDCWGAIEQADGHDVHVSAAAKGESTARLFFVNLGGYDPTEFTERHRNLLLVATDASSAKARALSMVSSWTQPHRDRLFEVEHTLDLSHAMAEQGISLQLSAASAQKPFAFQCGYCPIGGTRP